MTKPAINELYCTEDQCGTDRIVQLVAVVANYPAIKSSRVVPMEPCTKCGYRHDTLIARWDNLKRPLDPR